MGSLETDVRPMHDPEAPLEAALIEEFLRAHGHDARSIAALPALERRHLLEAASLYATKRLTEVQARAHYMQELKGER